MIDRTPFLNEARSLLTKSAWVKTGPNNYDRYVAVYGHVVEARPDPERIDGFILRVHGRAETRELKFADAELAEPIHDWVQRNRRAMLPRRDWDQYRMFTTPQEFAQRVLKAAEGVEPIPMPANVPVKVGGTPTTVTQETGMTYAEMAPQQLEALLRDRNLPIPAGDKRKGEWRKSAVEALEAVAA